MKLCNKYNVPQETIDKMVKDGVISASWPRYEEIYDLYKALSRSGRSKQDIYNEISDKTHISEASVKSICLKMDKI
jgi:hypothetical protein